MKSLLVKDPAMADIESPYDFRDPERATAWEREIHQESHWRSLFFAEIGRSLNASFPGPFSVLELGSGPGHLARAILSGTRARSYTALDYSSPMHALAANHLGGLAGKVCFEQRDFRDPDWSRSLGPFDVAVTMMAAHELRRADRLCALFAQVAGALIPAGRFLFADFYADAADDDLYLTRQGQRDALVQAGFGRVVLLLDENGMALHAADLGAEVRA